METQKEYFLCGGVLFFLLTKAALPDGTPRDHRAGVKDEHAEPILMQDLIYTFTGSQNYGAQKDTSKYKDCLIEGSSNVPFNEIAKCTTYGNLVAENYPEALRRMDEFVLWHMDIEMKVWLVKALLEIIESDSGIVDEEALFIQPDGLTKTKAEIKTEENYDFSAFLVGILHFILTRRREKNALGIPTLDAIGVKKTRKPRKYTGNLGEAITRKVEVAFLPERESAFDDLPSHGSESSVADAVIDQSDDEVINGAVKRSAMAVAEMLSAVPKPQINTEALAGAILPVAATIDASMPSNEQVTENMTKALSTVAAAVEANKHALAERIRENSRKEESASQTEIPGTEETAASDAAEDKKTTIIQQQTNVVQNGDNNVNVTNNGTITFNL